MTTTYIERGATADGRDLLLWSDGQLTAPLGYEIRGIGKPRDPVMGLRLGRYVLSRLGRLDYDEVPAFWGRARSYLRAHPEASDEALDGAMFRRAWTPHWVVTRADRRGKPEEKEWSLPRLGPLSGLVVSWSSTGRHRYGIWATKMACEVDPMSGKVTERIWHEEIWSAQTLSEVFAYLDDTLDRNERRPHADRD